MDVPALTCNQCVRRVITASGGDSQFQIYCGIDPCAAHSTLSAQPLTQATPSARASAMSFLAGANPTSPQPHAAGPPLNPTPPQPPAAGFPLNPTPTNPAAASNPGSSASAPPGPPGRNTTRSYSLATLMNDGTSLEDAYTITYVKRRTFRRYRTVRRRDW